MNVYRCSRCDAEQDNDYCPCVRDPKNPGGLMCENHAWEDEDEKSVTE